MISAADGLDFQRLFEATPAASLVLDPDLTIVGITDAYLTETGTTRDGLLGCSIFDILLDVPGEAGPSPVDNLRSSLLRVRERRTTDVMAVETYAIRRPDGGCETRHWAPVNAPIPGPDGAPAWIVHSVDAGENSEQDLSPQPSSHATAAPKFASQRRQDQSHTLWAVLDSLDTAIVGCDSAGRAVLTNRGARELFDLPADGDPVERWAQRSHLGFSDLHGNTIAPDDLPVELLLRGEPVRDMMIVAKADGIAARTFLVHGQPVAGDGRLAAVVALHEVTRQHRAEQLKECERMVAELLAKPEPPDHVITNTVELIGSMLGWAAIEFWSVDQVGQILRRKSCWALPGHDVACRLPDRLEKGVGLPGRAWDSTDPIWATDLSTDRHATQQTHDWLPLRAALAVPIPSGAYVLGVLVCYSDNHETPDDMRTAVMTGIAAHLGEFLERRRADQFAAELEVTRDEYIALVGHELRTPLASIQANADILYAEPDLPAEDRAQMLEVIHRRTADLHALIAKLLDVAGARAGHRVLNSRYIDLVEVAAAAVQHAKGGKTATAVAFNAPPRVMIDGDPDRLRNVIDELLNNALTWASGGSTVGLTLHGDDYTAVLAVTNTGARIPADQHARIFELFYRTDATAHHGIPGFGLGLTLARAIVEQHGGAITVSEPEEAVTTFTVTLPTHQPPAGKPGTT